MNDTITIDRKVVEQVLEALEADNSKLWPREKRTNAITALRAAIDAAEWQEQCPAPEMMGEHACKNKSQCWEPCGDLGHSEAHVRVVEKVEPVAWKPSESATEQLWEALGRWSAYIASNGCKAELAPPQYLLDAMDAFVAPPPAVPKGWQPTNEELTSIYMKANGIEGKNPPITTERIFTAMRAMLAAAPKETK